MAKYGIVAILVWFGLVITAVVGWIMNIVALIHVENGLFDSGANILRIIGIFVAPLGSIMGLFVS